MEDDNYDGFFDSKASVLLFGLGSAGIGRTSQQTQQDRQQHVLGHETLEITSLEISKAELIPVHKYRKGTTLVDDDGMCAVCLSQFEEEEELKTLPGCSHSYHASCIDMWLYSHSSCPMCRTNATMPRKISHHLPDSDPVRLGMGMLHNIVQARML
ncbi:hypothetical protein HRI_001740000 [Hibiscus trionum]|uniref:RING-type E3 ubiquitin transferase n=1 Tax=Hibiscus trionum TaxID=183268 RepID=A0A9W7LYC1_HIBTR|nr:hypothetical protein HRI_001740000 [Hibiscus trionum]